jgi:outer membrane protein
MPRPAPLLRTLALVAALAAGAASAQGAAEASLEGLGALDLLRFAQATTTHPGLRAAAASTEAARLRVAAVHAPITLSVAYEYRRLTIDPATDPLPPPFDELFAVDETSDSLTLSAAFRPFLVGDLRDLGDTRLAELERSELALRETRAGLEAQAVNAAVGVLLGERAVRLAGEGVALARRTAEATELRWQQGSATELERRRAALRVDDAERAQAAALRQVQNADDALTRLVGTARLRAIPDLEPRYDVPPELIRASLDVAMAELALRAQSRALLPTVQAGYTWLFADDGGSLTLGLESRTLQPSLSYATGGGGLGGGLGGGGLGGIGGTGGIPDGAIPTVRGAFSIGVSWTFSPQAALERDAAASTVEAAAGALAAAHDRAQAQRRALESGLAGAEEMLALARLELDLVRDERRAAEARFESGLIGPLELDAARLAEEQAELDLQRASADRLGAVLDFYTTYAIALSEVLP